MREIPVHSHPRRLADWINPTEAKKVHSLIDKVYQRKNLEMAWERVRANRGSGGVDKQTVREFGEQVDEQLNRLQAELMAQCYRPQPVRQVPIQDEANFGYRRGRSTHDALRKVWKEIKGGRSFLVDADLKDFFGSVDHDKLLALVARQVSDGRVLHLVEMMLKAEKYGQGRLFPSERGTPQGGVVSPLLSNILLTPFDWEMRRRGYRLTRYADDWVVTCESAAEAHAAIAAAQKILTELGVQLHPQKTRVVQVRHGFEFLGYKIKRGRQRLSLPASKIRSGARSGELYAFPRERSVQRFMDQVRQRTQRRVPLNTEELIQWINPVLRGWGNYFKRAHVRKLFNRLDRWIVRRIWSHRFKHWRCAGWKVLPAAKLYRDCGLVNLVGLIPSIASRVTAPS